MCEVTLAMPVYNVEKYVERSLLSALNQTFKSLEILIIDDRGTDNSMQIVKDVLDKHPNKANARIIDHVTNKGTGATKNTAIKEAHGKYIYFMDSDDVIRLDTIALLYEEMNKTHSDVVVASYQYVKNEKIMEKRVLPSDSYIGEFAISKWMEKNKLYFSVPTWNKLYSIQFLRAKGIYCFPTHRNEDTWFTFQVVMYAQSVSSVSEITYDYYLRDGSTISQKVNDFYYNQYLEIFDARKKLMESYRKNYPSYMYNYFLEPFFLFFIQGVLKSTLPEERKLFFLKRMREIYEMDFSMDDLVGIRFKIVYILLKKGLYKTMRIFYFIDNKMRGAYTKLLYRPLYPLVKPYIHV